MKGKSRTFSFKRAGGWCEPVRGYAEFRPEAAPSNMHSISRRCRPMPLPTLSNKKGGTAGKSSRPYGERIFLFILLNIKREVMLC
ncbi:hypothetical protein Toce_0175 [Thermosediminibacter oceani DSM 16646]|uniref:Uncharacterized protein n=1 Tax=Thermosediminibacter oceani (strain ATCC BAA-1034 / DSM 16646 / JW/IW-1228P) TaxID=555079 RepID=D9S037_THEOJ|nr:hypothetical protein Toce_0175 [Thermosediminibacter oceani DSM 16646]